MHETERKRDAKEEKEGKRHAVDVLTLFMGQHGLAIFKLSH